MTQSMPGPSVRRIWITRALIAPVIFFNLQCSFAFLVRPDLYVRSFDLSEPTGRYMIQGMGLLFLMWNIPYLFALSHPYRRQISLLESTVMQAIGFIGESILLFTVSSQYSALRGSVIRFMIFDGSGLLLLLAALWSIRRPVWFSKR